MHQFEIFPWNHNFDTGIAVIDTQHKELVRLLNALVSHIAVGAEPPVLEEVITELNNYVLYHFSTEEQIWAAHFEGDAWYRWHQQSHDDFIHEIEKIRTQESSRAFDETLLDIVKFLTHWLARHILDSDRRMAKVVQALPTGISLAMAKEAADAEMSGSAKVLVDTLMNMYDRLADSTVEMSKEIQRRQKAELELLRAKTQLEIGSQAKSVYLANLSHELRTPLNTILGYVELLRRNVSVVDVAGSELDVIHASGDHLLTVINEVLEIAKIEAGHAQVESEAVDLERIAQETAEMFQLRARDKGLTLRVELSAVVTECVISDEAKVRQIVINLVSNAINATRKGSVTVRVAMGDASATWATVEVEDTGVGIAEADLVRVFAPFERLAHADAVSGTGLGLAISREFSHVLGGSIEVRSKPAEGSVFRLSLPNKRVARGSLPPVTKIERDIRALSPGQASFRVLVVDDESTHRDLLTRLLAEVGFEVCEACDGEHAVALFQQWRPHFIWMDSHMPKLSGPDATRIIRGLDGGLVVRIAALTASIFSTEDIRSAGLDAVVHKPFSSHQIFDCMRVLLGVEYLYQSAPSVVPQGPLDLQPRLALQPQERKDALASAVETLSQDAVLSAIADIARDDPTLAVVLEQMARKYHYAALRQLLTDRAEASLAHAVSSSLNDVNRNLEAKVAQRTADLLRERNIAQKYLDVAGVALFALDPMGHVRMMNRTGEVLFGVQEASVLGMSWFDEFVHAHDRDAVWQRYRELIADGVATNTHWLLNVVRADGQVRSVSCSTKMLDAVDAGAFGVLFSAEDVTEVLRVQKALQLSEEKYRARATELDDALAQLRRLTAHMHDSIERERMALATDIHDHVGASLTGARLLLDQLSRTLTHIPKQQHAMLEQACVAVSQALVSSRGVYAQLRPPMLDDLGLVHTMRWYLDDWAQKTSIHADSAIHALPQEPGEMLRMDIFRMFQELLTNVARHAGASHVKVQMQVNGESLVLQVSDDGCGLHGDTPAGFGLQGIRGRLNRYGGGLQIENRPPRGAILTACMPSLALQQQGPMAPQAEAIPGGGPSQREGYK